MDERDVCASTPERQPIGDSIPASENTHFRYSALHAQSREEGGRKLTISDAMSAKWQHSGALPVNIAALPSAVPKASDTPLLLVCGRGGSRFGPFLGGDDIFFESKHLFEGICPYPPVALRPIHEHGALFFRLDFCAPSLFPCLLPLYLCHCTCAACRAVLPSSLLHLHLCISVYAMRLGVGVSA